MNENINPLKVCRIARIMVLRKLGRTWAGLRLSNIGILWPNLDESILLCWRGMTWSFSSAVWRNTIPDEVVGRAARYDGETDVNRIVASYVAKAVERKIRNHEPWVSL